MNKGRQMKTFEKLKRVYTAKNLFDNEKLQTEFESYWKRYRKKMIEAQDPTFIRRVKKLFKHIEKTGNDDSFVESLEIKKVNDIKGYGVFAKVKIPKQTMLTHYAGIMKKDEGSWGKKNRYIFGLTGTKKLEEWVIDAKTTCNIGSFFNHSKEPNVQAYEYYDEKGPKIIFETLREIQPNEELVYDYGNEYWKGLKQKPI